MTSMVERVARTLCTTRGVDPDKEVHCQGGGILYEWHWWEREARAAIAAMREPTEGMLEGMSSLITGEVEDYNVYLGREDATEAWQLAIDAALEEKP